MSSTETHQKLCRVLVLLKNIRFGKQIFQSKNKTVVRKTKLLYEIILKIFRALFCPLICLFCPVLSYNSENIYCLVSLFSFIFFCSFCISCFLILYHVSLSYKLYSSVLIFSFCIPFFTYTLFQFDCAVYITTSIRSDFIKQNFFQMFFAHKINET